MKMPYTRNTNNTATRPSPLDRRSGIPLYHQIQQRLLARIQSGEFKPGDPLPSIERIAEQMGVSPMTVRQAVRSLVDLGVIYSRQGKGTFLSSIKLERDFRHVLSFTEETEARGAHATSTVLSFTRQAPSAQTRELLRLPEDVEVFCLRRVRYGDSIPMGIECTCLPVSLCPALMETFDPTTSLYQELAERYGIQMMVTDEVIEVGLASNEEARLLHIDPKSPVFLFTRTSYLESGLPVEYVASVYPGERYKIVNRLTRTKPTAMTIALRE